MKYLNIILIMIRIKKIIDLFDFWKKCKWKLIFVMLIYICNFRIWKVVWEFKVIIGYMRFCIEKKKVFNL